MTPRKPKPRKPSPRKASGPTLAQRIDDVVAATDQLIANDFNLHSMLISLRSRIDALETRSRYRDASHDEPVSNASEAIGHFTLTEPHRPWWRRFIGFMGAA